VVPPTLSLDDVEFGFRDAVRPAGQHFAVDAAAALACATLSANSGRCRKRLVDRDDGFLFWRQRIRLRVNRALMVCTRPPRTPCQNGKTAF
jgi:hypothetical protein